ncbi:MAG: HdeD family acid-resistance protein [Ktedonobacterales bacterium]
MFSPASAASGPSLPTLSRNWWVVVLRGVIAIIFGILALIFPGHVLIALVLIFGIYAILDGIFTIVAAIRAVERQARWFTLLIEGIVSIVAGIIAFFFTGLAALALLYLIAAWAIITGIVEIVSAIRLRREIHNEWLLILSGALSILFGIVMFIFTASAALALVWVIGVYALIFGGMLIGLGLRLRAMRSLQTAPLYNPNVPMNPMLPNTPNAPNAPNMPPFGA